MCIRDSLRSSFGAWWGDSLTRPRLDISGRPSARGGAILSLAPGWTSPVILRRLVGRFSHSPQAGHLRSSFGAWWGRFSHSPQAGHLRSSFGAWWGDSLTRPRLDISGHSSSSQHGLHGPYPPLRRSCSSHAVSSRCIPT